MPRGTTSLRTMPLPVGTTPLQSLPSVVPPRTSNVSNSAIAAPPPYTPVVTNVLASLLRARTSVTTGVYGGGAAVAEFEVPGGTTEGKDWRGVLPMGNGIV